MCGIVGVVDRRKPIDEPTLIAMRDALAHRGPDDAGVWISQEPDLAIGLGHRRLSILDTSSLGHQPMLSADGAIAVVFNGEIYNYLELARELRSLGHVFRTGTDTEVLLASYQQWGLDAFSRFNGMWALALWDRSRRRLLLSRDRLGKKPLFYTQIGETFLFASEIKALGRHPAVSLQPDRDVVETFGRTFALETGDATFFQGVRRLPPAHHLLIESDGHVTQRRYWQIDPAAELAPASNAEFAERFRDLFCDAVRVRLRADVPVGSSLSGGLDSSLIVGAIADFRKHGLAGARQTTFSARFPGDATFDEGAHIDAVIAHTTAEAHAVTPTPAGLLTSLRQLTYHQEEPFLSTSIFAQWEVMRLARQNQTTILLDGQGSDELLAGYIPYVETYLLQLSKSRDWRTAWREYRAFTARQNQVRRLLPEFAMRSHPLSVRALFQRALRKLARNLFSAPVLTQNSVGGGTTGLPPGANARSPLWRRLFQDLTVHSIPVLLRYADRNAMAFSIETRNPFLDYRLVEFLMALPDSQRIQNGWTKFIQRNASVDLIPESIRWRVDKVGYITPEDQWLRGPLRDWASKQWSSDHLRQWPSYSREKTESAWRQHLAGAGHFRSQLWPWLSLKAWLESLQAGDFQASQSPSRQAA